MINNIRDFTPILSEKVTLVIPLSPNTDGTLADSKLIMQAKLAS